MYIGRNSDNSIYGLWTVRQWEGQEWSDSSPQPTPEQIKAQLSTAVQAHLDAEARLSGYDNIVSACSYAASPNAFQTEGVSFLNWRAAVWVKCYQTLTEVQAGAAIPTEAALIASLPLR